MKCSVDVGEFRKQMAVLGFLIQNKKGLLTLSYRDAFYGILDIKEALTGLENLCHAISEDLYYDGSCELYQADAFDEQAFPEEVG